MQAASRIAKVLDLYQAGLITKKHVKILIHANPNKLIQELHWSAYIRKAKRVRK